MTPRLFPQLIGNGRVPTAGIGIVAGDEAVATRHGVEGVIVAPGSSAERAGLRGVNASAGTLGDVIVGANGKRVHRLAADLTEQLEQIGIGRKVRLSVRKGGIAPSMDIDVEVIDIGQPPG